MQPLSGNQRPDLLTSLMTMSFVLRLPRKCIFADPLQMSHACYHPWKCYKTLTFWSLLTRCTIPCACHAKRHLNLQKLVRTCDCLYILTSKCASRHNGVHFFDISTAKSVRTPSVLCILTWKCASRHNDVHFFDISTVTSGPRMVCFVHFDLEMCFAPQRRALFDISTSKSGPTMVCFVHFDFEMCFAPQRRALFRHLKCQKWSAPLVFFTFWLGNVLRATTACNFISPLASWLRNRRFS